MPPKKSKLELIQKIEELQAELDRLGHHANETMAELVKSQAETTWLRSKVEQLEENLGIALRAEKRAEAWSSVAKDVAKMTFDWHDENSRLRFALQIIADGVDDPASLARATLKNNDEQ